MSLRTILYENIFSLNYSLWDNFSRDNFSRDNSFQDILSTILFMKKNCPVKNCLREEFIVTDNSSSTILYGVNSFRDNSFPGIIHFGTFCPQKYSWRKIVSERIVPGRVVQGKIVQERIVPERMLPSIFVSERIVSTKNCPNNNCPGKNRLNVLFLRICLWKFYSTEFFFYLFVWIVRIQWILFSRRQYLPGQFFMNYLWRKLSREKLSLLYK